MFSLENNLALVFQIGIISLKQISRVWDLQEWSSPSLFVHVRIQFNFYHIFCIVLESVGQTVLSKRDAILEEHNKSVHGYLGATYTYNTFKETVTECQLSQDKLRHEVFGEKEIFNEAVYAESKWCHDTPGLVNPEQVQINNNNNNKTFM